MTLKIPDALFFGFELAVFQCRYIITPAETYKKQRYGRENEKAQNVAKIIHRTKKEITKRKNQTRHPKQKKQKLDH